MTRHSPLLLVPLLAAACTPSNLDGIDHNPPDQPDHVGNAVYIEHDDGAWASPFGAADPVAALQARVQDLDLSGLEAGLIAPGSDAGQGGLEVVQGEERYALPLLDTEVRVEIDGTVAVTQVSQLFANPFDEPIEAVYVYPLPDDGAVDDMLMVVGERVIEGEIHRREEARRIYEQARDRGQTAALLEQERPNIFTQSVANILPGEVIEVAIEVVSPLHYEDGEYSVHFPMTVGPRFMPGQAVGHQGTGDSPDTTAVPDASRISPPVAPTGRSGHDIHLLVDLESGVPFHSLASATHEITIDKDADSHAFVELDAGETIPNRDFELTWRLADDAPLSAVVAEHDGDSGYFSLLVEPPAAFTRNGRSCGPEAPQHRPPRRRRGHPGGAALPGDGLRRRQSPHRPLLPGSKT